ncbi:MAG: CatB-related O-acetyltransferase [Lachnospiraceae bacterium]|nr:CatB-related O-acetyltransferase [Lachnospiraceae bacterium]
MGIECKTRSVMRPGSYLHGHSQLAGRNYIGRKTVLCHTTVGFGSQVNDAGDLTDTRIGNYTSIGTHVSTVIGNHPLDEHAALHTAFYDASAPLGFTYVSKSTYCDTQYLDEKERIQVRIGNDVWIGNDVRILSGVTIGDGAVIGTGAVVTKDAEPYGIYAGVPAKLIRKRYDDETVAALLAMKWWDRGEDWIRSHIDLFANVEELLRKA